MIPTARYLAILGLLSHSSSATAAAVSADTYPNPEVLISVNAHVKYQELDGFGASQAFQRAEDILGKDGLSKEGTEHVLDLLFSQENGAGFAILRNGIGSSNSSASNFMNSIEPCSPGSPSANPHYVWDGYDSGQFPVAQEAYRRGLKFLYGDAWSAPGYMKTNHDENNGGSLCGVTNATCASGDWKQAYADYLLQWVDFYRKAGVKVTNLGFLNEPQFAATYAGMISDGTQAADFIRVLAKTIRKKGVKDLTINCCDGIGWDDQEDMIAGLTAGPDPAIDYLGVVSGHGYKSPPDHPLSTTKKTWLTEWADLTGDFTPYTFYNNSGQGEGMTWASRIQTAFVDANVSGFLYWIGAENSTTNSALINMVGNEIIPSKRFWAFASFSKFARPGARRIEATSSTPLITVSSFLNSDGSVATQVLNNDTVAHDIRLELSGTRRAPHTLKPYLTDNEHDLTPLKNAKAVGKGYFKTTIPARSLVSFVAD
jgi:O-glycosyl hydrolase